MPTTSLDASCTTFEIITQIDDLINNLAVFFSPVEFARLSACSKRYQTFTFKYYQQQKKLGSEKWTAIETFLQKKLVRFFRGYCSKRDCRVLLQTLHYAVITLQINPIFDLHNHIPLALGYATQVTLFEVAVDLAKDRMGYHIVQSLLAHHPSSLERLITYPIKAQVPEHAVRGYLIFQPRVHIIPAHFIPANVFHLAMPPPIRAMLLLSLFEYYLSNNQFNLAITEAKKAFDADACFTRSYFRAFIQATNKNKNFLGVTREIEHAICSRFISENLNVVKKYDAYSLRIFHQITQNPWNTGAVVCAIWLGLSFLIFQTPAWLIAASVLLAAILVKNLYNYATRSKRICFSPYPGLFSGTILKESDLKKSDPSLGKNPILLNSNK